jgi:hypothetical protein
VLAILFVLILLIDGSPADGLLVDGLLVAVFFKPLFILWRLVDVYFWIATCVLITFFDDIG